MKKVVSLVLALLLAATAFAGCGTPAPTESKADESTGESTAGEPVAGAVAKGPDDVSAPYEFTIYCNYDWWTVKPWGEDEASKFLKEKFNVDVKWTKPDADPAAKLNLMLASDDLPEAMVLDRNADFLKIARAGKLLDLAPLQYEGNSFDQDIQPQTQELLKVDGKLYCIPNWARNWAHGAATGGNYSWIVNQRAYKSVNSPKLTTLADLHDYALAVKNAGIKTEKGEDYIPFMTGDTPDGSKLFNGFYRSFGGANQHNTWYAHIDGKMQLLLRDPVFNKAILEANKWYTEGLFSEAVFADTGEQVNEKLANGRPALLYYDFSQDDVNHFRQILRTDTNNENSYEICTEPLFPHAEGVTKVYGEENNTVGGSAHVITTKAENPQRIFDLFTWMLTKEGSVNMMYGPKGGLWDELDKDGNPVLKKAESLLSAEEKDKAGCWMWAQPAHADNVDMTKFAVNAALKPEEQSFVITNQANFFSNPAVEGSKFLSDESVGLFETIDPQDDLGIQRKLIEDKLKETVPKIILAKDATECQKLYDEALKFCEDNGIAEIEAKYDEKHQANCKIQG
ncbi:MAG: extracellular solute-binding protein, partial [Oscillospiraceae bacterium]